MIVKNAFFITSAATPEQFIKSDKPVIAVVGKSNVGKSSFINMLAGMHKLAKTSDTPGRTRLVNYFDLGDFLLADLPGYGYAKVSKAEKDKWAITMENFFTDITCCDYVLFLVDCRHNPTVDDIVMINYLHSSNISFSLVATKIDKLSRTQVRQNIKNIANKFAVTENEIYSISSKTRQGREEILEKIGNIITIIRGGNGMCDD